MTQPPAGFDPDRWRDFEERMRELGERARPTEDELARTITAIMTSADGQALLRDFADLNLSETDPALHRLLQQRFMFAPVRVRRAVRKAGLALRAALPPTGPPCQTCGHDLAAHRDDGAGACCQPDCSCSAFASRPEDTGLPANWPPSWPVPALQASAEIQAYERDRLRQLKEAEARARAREDAEFEALVASIQPPPLPPALLASAARVRPPAPAKPYSDRRGLVSVKVIGDDPGAWEVADKSGVVLDNVRVDDRCQLVVTRPSLIPFEVGPLPDTGNRARDAILAFAQGAIDKVTLLAHQEAQLAHEAGAVEKLAAEVRRLADRPAPHITVTPPDVHVTVPEPKPVDVEKLAGEIGRRLPAPQVHVEVQQPKPRGVRVEIDADGNRRYVPFDLDEGDG
jgi:hypothetical protein